MCDSHYQWDADDYARNSSGQFRWARELLDKLVLGGKEIVLDIGCGDGRFSAYLAAQLDREGQVIAVDSSQNMIDFATRSYPQYDHPNLVFRRMDARHFSFQEEFNLVFSSAALHWIKDHTAVLQGISQSLKHEGRTLLQMGGQGNAQGVISALDKVVETSRWAVFFLEFAFPYGFYGIGEYRKLLAEAGLKADRVDLIKKDMQHTGKASLLGWIRTTWLPYIERIPEASRTDFVEDVVEAYLEDNPLDSKGLAHVQMVRLEVVAQKP